MSAVIPQALSKVLVVDPMCDFQSEAVYAVEKSVSNSNYYNISSNNSSVQSTTWTINVNDNTTITDRLFLMDITFKLTVPISNGANPAVIGRYPANNVGALRSFPLLKWSNNYVLTLGNATCTLQSGQIANCIERYGLLDKYLDYSSTPNFCDTDQPYTEPASVANPLSNSFYLQSEKCTPRGAFYVVNQTRSGTGLVLEYRVIEPIFLSPLIQSMGIKARKEGMTKLSQIQFTVNWGDPSRLWSSTCALTSKPTVEMVGAKSLLRVVQYVPSALDIGRNINTQALPYNEIITFATAEQSLDLRQSNALVHKAITYKPFTSPTIQLSRIPKELYLFCRPSDTTYSNPQTGTTCVDNFAVYENLSLRVNFNGQNLLSSISDINLYRICVENGCNLPFSSWSGQVMSGNDLVGDNAITYGAGVGSPICLKFGKDISLPPELAPGTNSKCNLQVEANFGSPCFRTAGALPTAYDGGSLPYVMYLTIVYEGVIEFYGSGGTVAQTLGALTVNDVLETTKRNERVHYDIVNNGSFGGSMVDNAKNFVKGKAHSLMSKMRGVFNNPAVRDMIKANPDVDQVVEAMSGRGMSGGKSMSKASLKRALLG
jgi:hypothetical protein